MTMICRAHYTTNIIIEGTTQRALVYIARCIGNHELIFFVLTFGTIEIVINFTKLATHFLGHPVINHYLILFDGYFCQKKTIGLLNGNC